MPVRGSAGRARACGRTGPGPTKRFTPRHAKPVQASSVTRVRGLIDAPPGIATSGPGPSMASLRIWQPDVLPGSDCSARTARMSPRRPRAKHLRALMLTLRRRAFVDVAAGRAGVGPVGRLRGLGWYGVVGDRRGPTECVPGARPPLTGSGSPLCQEAAGSGVLGSAVAGPGSGLSEEPALGCEPVALESESCPVCPPGPVLALAVACATASSSMVR
jgi:hypothetical protein